jgi:hypothetical protein
MFDFSRNRTYRDHRSGETQFTIVRTPDDQIELWWDYKMVAKMSFQQWSHSIGNSRIRKPLEPIVEEDLSPVPA